METQKVITQLINDLQHIESTVKHKLEPLELDLLNRKSTPESWSALECIEHLNRYHRFYNPHLKKAISKAAPVNSKTIKTTWFGRKSLELMANSKKQTTLKRMNPVKSRLSLDTIHEFIRHQQELLTLFPTAHKVNLNTTSVPVEFLRLLKLKTGEAFLFVVAHEKRHLKQALEAAGLPSNS